MPDVLEPDDARFAVVDRGRGDVARILEAGKLHASFDDAAAAEAVGRADGALKEITYSYADPATLRGMDATKRLTGAADALVDALGGPDWRETITDDAEAVATVAWWIGTVRSLPARLDLEGGPEVGVDAAAGRVLAIQDHPRTDAVRIARVAAGRSVPVVTNDPDVAQDDRVGVAFLPPSTIHGTVSEGMLLGAGDGVLSDVSPDDEGRPDVPDEAWVETRNILSGYVDG